VAGDVEAGSIVRVGTEVAFTLHQEKLRLKVVYDGTDPLPDTFRDGAQAMADGRWARMAFFERIRSRPSAPPNTRRNPVSRRDR